ncbi:polyprenyl synthetase family protein [Truepera radiovictrix]|uniref:Polyprenyl synthetase n=1 Tax=Truepera radiovictrix (strain DSM 17093 / CIP 108686 / LMG 22925 / RQ-24) TaxID=649638 RepID=D7CUF6_TRURR|nr:polyprenyl synthetase family protein [Truepera radiovictrix]ADI15741.1 Polyprenyl synthetase [Truepera radiovictrix DSM 17093]WMT58634.1 polyprenyl synthetase family protein [Truepera radiovictrix]
MFDLIQQDLSDFEARLTEELYSPVEFIGAIGEDLVHAGGKRLRPSLAFLTGRLLGAEREAAMRVALAVELLHSASLLHDDLIDDASTRRGVVAAFRRYGNVVSVMSGDFMLARVLGILAEADAPSFTRLMSETAARICEGEVLQFQMASLETYSLEHYNTIIEGKTAVLLAAATEGVALLAGAAPGARRALRAFGLHYGRAFQMRDDLLDLMSDPETLGKPIGGDLREGKATFAVLTLLEAGVEEARTILRRHASEPGDVERMLELVRAHGAEARAAAQIALEAQAAMRALEPFEEGPAKRALVSLAERELERVR